jgi:hypothetical protein
MRILTLGVPMPGAAIDNHNFANAPAIFDYGAVVADPASITSLAEGIATGAAQHTTRAGQPVSVDEAGGAITIAALLRARRRESERLLARGGLIVCLAQPNGCVAAAGIDRYSWLPAPDSIEYAEPFLCRAEGAEIAPAERAEPFGSFIEMLRGKLAYRAFFDTVDGAARVIARSAGGAAVAIELIVDGGRVVFVPPPAKALAGDERYAFSNAMQEAIRQTLRPQSASAPPAWVSEHRVPSADDEQAGRLRRLLWEEGIALEEAVREAMTLLGLRVIAHDIDTPAEVAFTGDRGERQAALLEVDGSIDAVGLAGHFRLRRRIEDAIVAGKAKRGLLVINGNRTRSPGERAAQYSDPLRIASETFRYCVATGAQLFAGARAALEGDNATVADLRERLLTHEGILQGA